MSLSKAHRAAELADAIESAYTKRSAARGTKIPIQQSDWPLMIEALRLCEALLRFEAKQSAREPQGDGGDK